MSPEVIAGTISTSMFAMGNIPMLVKASRTRSLASYSRSQLSMNSAANLIHWLYVSGLPFGPIWFLHSFHTVATGLMFVWYFRYEVGCFDLSPERLLAPMKTLVLGLAPLKRERCSEGC